MKKKNEGYQGRGMAILPGEGIRKGIDGVLYARPLPRLTAMTTDSLQHPPCNQNYCSRSRLRLSSAEPTGPSYHPYNPRYPSPKHRLWSQRTARMLFNRSRSSGYTISWVRSAAGYGEEHGLFRRHVDGDQQGDSADSVDGRIKDERE